MSFSYRETAEQQAYLTRFLLDYTALPMAEGVLLRGVLPTRDAVRIVTGGADAVLAHELVAYEIPLADEDDEAVTAPLVLGWTRTLLAGPSPRTHTTVMGMPLVLVDTTALEPASPVRADRTLRVLRTLAWPFVESPPSPALCGFFFTGPDSMRLYLAVEKAAGLIAADVRTTGALTALLAALPSLVEEEERWATDASDPHCARVIDLTSW
ncbi:MAG TPA: hypothetical protein VN520_37655 [Streptomyces sp.]|uniref:hypothetical protein n=1 Tax=Streptomyces sp. TaxID=1931 RepID=UPI002CC820CB|nr:hypothetical protein [Streptomyces sp.]HWU12011.1 hypothetical protein [Streptomyces sp.]